MSDVKIKHCFECNNEGQEPKCPKCGRKKSSLNLAHLPEKEAERVITRAKTIYVPEQYEGVSWSKEMFIRTKGGLFNKDNLYLGKYLDQLQKVHDVFAEGKIPAKSFFICAPSTYSKTLFAYSCMQHALSNNMSVAPMLDTLELKRVLVLSAENPTYKWHGWLDYDKYIMSDIMFVSVTKTEYRKQAYEVLREIISIRSRIGLGVGIISDVPLNELSAFDKTKNFDRMFKESHREDNNLKYPAVIQYWEGLV